MKQIILAVIVTLNLSLILATPLTIINGNGIVDDGNGSSEEIIAGDAIIQNGIKKEVNLNLPIKHNFTNNILFSILFRSDYLRFSYLSIKIIYVLGQ